MNLISSVSFSIGGSYEGKKYFCKSCSHRHNEKPEICNADCEKYDEEAIENLYITDNDIKQLYEGKPYSEVKEETCKLCPCDLDDDYFYYSGEDYDFTRIDHDLEEHLDHFYDELCQKNNITDIPLYREYKCNGKEFEYKDYHSGHVLDSISGDYLQMYNEMINGGNN